MIKLGGTKKKVIQLWEDFLSGGRFCNYFFWFGSDAGVNIFARLVLSYKYSLQLAVIFTQNEKAWN